MATPTDTEQYILQLINRARTDPTGETARLITNFATLTGANSDITAALKFFGVDPNLMVQQLATAKPVAPLAWNSALNDAAAAHSAKMIQTDTQDHVLPGEADLGTRFQAAGYNWSSIGENIAAYSANALSAHASLYIDWGTGTGGMQNPPGHRNNILSTSFTEIGINATPVNTTLPHVGPLVVTEDFGTTFNYKAQIVGVVINDLNNDNFYNPGEGVAGVTVRAVGSSGTFTTTTWSSGGYDLAAPAGTYTLTFSGGPLTLTRVTTVTLGAANTEADFVTHLTPGSVAGTAGNDTIQSSGSTQAIDGLAGVDTVKFTNAHTAYAIAGIGTASVSVSAGAVITTLTNIERLSFSDEIIALDLTGNAGQAYRMYQAAFARTPDKTGVSFWVNQVDKGLSLHDLGQSFISSAEFKGIYGANPNVSTLVTGFYTNVLGRPPDSVGLNFWVGQVQSGMSTADLLVSFSESTENKAHVAPAIQNGIELSLSFFA